jgi:hypothetical protein
MLFTKKETQTLTTTITNFHVEFSQNTSQHRSIITTLGDKYLSAAPQKNVVAKLQLIVDVMEAPEVVMKINSIRTHNQPPRKKQ